MSEDRAPYGPGPGGADGAPAGDAPGGELVGRIVAGRYRIVRLLGQGAQSTVYLGEHQAIGRLDAIKVLRRELAGDREAVGRLTRGARNVSAIRHPNVCTVYDYSTTEDGLPFLAMELVEGDSLKEILEREGRLPVARALAITAQVADALDAAHAAGIVHRDLKPGNVMVSPGRDGAEQVKVVDFDIAKATSEVEGEVTRLGYVVGTPEYMSPEQLMGEPLDGSSDVYSLGLLVFRTLTGVLPFRTPVLQDLLIERLTQPPLALSDVMPDATWPAGLQALLDRALQRKAAERGLTAAEFARELRRLGDAVSGTAATPGAAGAPAQAGRPAAPGTPPVASEVPLTRIAPAFTGPAGAGTGGAPAGGRRRTRLAVLGVGVVALLAVAGFGARELLRGPAPSAAAPGAGADGVGAASTTAAPGPAADGVAPASAPNGIAAADDPAPTVPAPAARTSDDPREDGAGAAPPSSGRAAEAPADGGGSASRPAPASPPAATTIADPAGVLDRLFDRVGPPYPERASLTAILDSASALWGMQSLGSARRGDAAYVAGVAAAGLGAPAECVRWLNRALSLKPGNRGYQVMLDNCRSSTP